MGSGSAACKESEMVLDLVERFLEAGFSVETAIRMMNSAMVMKGESDLYSTVDLCMVNLYDGAADFYKIGAAGSFIRHGQENWDTVIADCDELLEKYIAGERA